MFIPFALAMVLGIPGEEPAAKELFAKEDWYRMQEGKEIAFEGLLKYRPRDPNVVGFNRYNPFTLDMGPKAAKPTVREVHVAGKDELLKPYAGKRVRITGKAVDMEVEGKMHFEIWPARIEPLPEKK